jgi:sugar phosphate isomerase/epimerase
MHGDGQNRREFLKSLASAGLGGALLTTAACASGRSAAAAAPDLTAAPLADRIGVQLYSVRDQLARDFDATMARVAQIGYDQVEFAGYYDRTPEQIRALLDRLHLTAPSSHIPLADFRNDLDGVIASAETIGHRYVTIPHLSDAEHGSTVQSWRSLAQEFNRYAAATRKQGIGFAYHNHNFEFAALPGGETGYDVLMRETDPSLVDFEMDLYWTVFAGRDPIELFNRYPGRIKMWHVKDLMGTGDDKHMVPVGTGTIDFKRIFDNARLSGMRYFFVEQDNAAESGDSLASIATSYQNLHRMLA